jgi:flagellar hook-length control protein FliK
MPNLALASPSPAAALGPSAPTAATALAGTDPAAGGDYAQGSPFATVLQEQLAAQILMPLPAFVGLPAAETAADAPADGAAVDMFPMLLEMAGAQGQAAADAMRAAGTMAAATSGDRGDEAATALLPTDAAALVPLALPAIAGTAAHLAQERGAGETAAERPAASANAATPAILAAATDAARRGDARATGGKAEEAFAGVGADPVAHRHDAAAQTQEARPAELPQRIEAPVGSRQWDGEFANRLAWMAGRQEQRAELVLTPPALGRIEVSLSVSGDQATAIFTSASATVRDAIENALPRLREVLLESGINLGQAQVGSESPQQSPTREENGDNRGNAVAAGHDSRGMPPGFAVNSPTAWISSGRGMIDIFA